MISPVYALTNIPEWIKNNAAWWADGQIDDSTFVQGIQYMIKNEIIIIIKLIYIQLTNLLKLVLFPHVR